MKKLQIIIFLILFTFHSFSQTKEIKGDTIYWYKSNIELQKTLDLKNFEKSNDEFNFRYRDHGQVIEISKNAEHSIVCVDNWNFAGDVNNVFYTTPFKKVFFPKNFQKDLPDKFMFSTTI